MDAYHFTFKFTIILLAKEHVQLAQQHKIKPILRQEPNFLRIHFLHIALRNGVNSTTKLEI